MIDLECFFVKLLWLYECYSDYLDVYNKLDINILYGIFLRFRFKKIKILCNLILDFILNLYNRNI